MTDESKAARDVAMKRIDGRYEDFMTRVNEIPLSRILFRPMFKDPLRSGLMLWRTLFVAESTISFIQLVEQQKISADVSATSHKPISVEMSLAIIASYKERIATKKFGAIPFVAHQFGLYPGTVFKIISMRGFKKFEPLHPDIEMAIKASVLPLVYKLVSGENHAA